MRIGRYRVRAFFAWYDLWVGLYIDQKGGGVYLCPLPTLVLHISRERYLDPQEE